MSKIKQERDKKKNMEKEVLEKLREKNGDFKKIKEEITPKALKNCESSSLLMAMKVVT